MALLEKLKEVLNIFTDIISSCFNDVYIIPMLETLWFSSLSDCGIILSFILINF